MRDKFHFVFFNGKLIKTFQRFKTKHWIELKRYCTSKSNWRFSPKRDFLSLFLFHYSFNFFLAHLFFRSTVQSDSIWIWSSMISARLANLIILSFCKNSKYFIPESDIFSWYHWLIWYTKYLIYISWTDNFRFSILSIH